MAQYTETIPVWQGWFSASILNFDYTEFDKSNAIFNREYGILPGVKTGIKRTKGAVQVQAQLAYHGNNVRYEGQTQRGNPARSRTDEKITELSLLLKGFITESNLTSSALYGGLGYRHWRRDIKSTRTASGLLEYYMWPYWILGTTVSYHFQPKTQLQFDVRITQPINPSMRVHFKKNNLDSRELELNARLGGRIGLSLSQTLTKQLAIAVEPYYQSWNLERSAPVPLKSNGMMIGGSITQPRSETRNSGLDFTIIYKFK